MEKKAQSLPGDTRPEKSDDAPQESRPSLAHAQVGSNGRVPNHESDQASEETQALLLRYHEMIDFAPECYILTDTRGIILRANYAASELLQTRREFLNGKPLAMFVGVAERSAFYGHLGQFKGSSAVRRWKTSLRTPKGEDRSVIFTASVLGDAHGGMAGFRWLLQDITLAQRVEQSLFEQKAFADSLADMLAAIVLVVDTKGRILRSNPYLHSISGNSADELCHTDWCERFLPEPDRAQARRMVAQARAHGTSGTGVLGFMAPGRQRFFVWSARSLAEDTESTSLVLLGYDVTELQEAQQRMLQAERLAAIGQMVAGLAHESRNALQSSQACIEMLRWRVQDRPDALDLLDRVEKSQDTLHRLYEEVREFAAPLRLELRLTNLALLWREAWADLAVVRKGRDAQLAEEDSCANVECLVSPFHIKQVFRNILDNALSAARDPVRIMVRCAGHAVGGRDGIQIAIQDNGPGLTTELRQKIFEPFYTTKTHGTGLGLAICKRIVEAHGGSITARAAPGAGAEIVITLPRRSQ